MAAGAEDAFVEAVKDLAILRTLKVLPLSLLLGRLSLQEGLDLLVLSVEVGHVDNEILEDEHEHEGGDDALLIVSLGDTAETGQVVTSVDIH